MKKGINGWTFPRGTPLKEAARTAQQAGFDTIEPTIEAEGVLSPATDEATCRRLAGQVREAGVEISSVATGLYWQTSLTSPDPAEREAARTLTIACLERAAWMGAPALLVVPGVVGHFNQPTRMVTGYAEALRYTYDALRGLVHEAETHGVVIAIENVWNQFLLSPVEMADLIDRISSPWLAAYFDTGNVLKFGFPQDWIMTLGGRIARVHVKDFKLSVGTIEGFCPLGEGDVDWPEVVRALRQVGYDGPLTFEGPGDPADIARRIGRILESA